MMHTTYESRYAIGPGEVKALDTEGLRSNFLIEHIFTDDAIRLVYTHYDRYIAGGAKPVTKPLPLEPIDPLKAAYFLERRELGIINVGGTGTVTVDGTAHVLNFKDALYIGRGAQSVVFASDDPANPAKFYLNSASAHRAYPVRKVSRADAQIIELGSVETANHRVINKLLVSGVIETCQLQMGMTELKTGSVWNTMPAHTHDRRMEVYFYFEVPEGQAVCHFMGQPEESRHIWMHNEQAVISPPWSIHAGAGTSNYTFIWGMVGENLDYDDMDKKAITDLK